jgi:hypothetical protein
MSALHHTGNKLNSFLYFHIHHSYLQNDGKKSKAESQTASFLILMAVSATGPAGNKTTIPHPPSL